VNGLFVDHNVAHFVDVVRHCHLDRCQLQGM